MRCVLTRTAAVGGLAVLALVLAGCGQGSGGGEKIDLAKVEDNQVALNVEGMV
jgi:hypothetical protein